MKISTKDGKTLEVRALTRADAEALRDFDSGLSRESHRKFFPHRYDAQTLEKVLARAENKRDDVLGVFDGLHLVGYFFLWNMDEKVPLLGIGITDAFQGRGLGRRMMAILIDRAVRAGKAGIDLTTMRDNAVAFALYEKMGFEYYGDVENRTGDGTTVVERAMFYAIVPGAKPPDKKKHGPPV